MGSLSERGARPVYQPGSDSGSSGVSWETKTGPVGDQPSGPTLETPDDEKSNCALSWDKVEKTKAVRTTDSKSRDGLNRPYASVSEELGTVDQIQQERKHCL